MTGEPGNGVIAVLGIGPGLGLSIARRWAAEGWTAAVVSRSPDRHPSYLAALAGESSARGGAGEKAANARLTGEPATKDHRAYAADLTDPGALANVLKRIRTDLGRIDAVYYGPAVGGANGITPLPESDANALREPLESMLLPIPAMVQAVLPDMLTAGNGMILLAGGLSGLKPMAMLGNLAPASAAVRMYALTLNAALKDQGVYVGTLTIGGLVAGGDIHRLVDQGRGLPTLDPDEIAAGAWALAEDRTEPEAVFERMPF